MWMSIRGAQVLATAPRPAWTSFNFVWPLTKHHYVIVIVMYSIQAPSPLFARSCHVSFSGAWPSILTTSWLDRLFSLRCVSRRFIFLFIYCLYAACEIQQNCPGNTVWFMPERLWGFTTKRYINPLYMYHVARWLSGRASDLRSSSRGFEARPRRCCVTTLGKLFTPYCLCHQAV